MESRSSETSIQKQQSMSDFLKRSMQKNKQDNAIISYLTFVNVFLKRNLSDNKIGLITSEGSPGSGLIEFFFHFVISHGGRRTDYELNLMNVSHFYEWNASKERKFEVNSEWAGEVLIVSSILVYDVTGVGTRPWRQT